MTAQLQPNFAIGSAHQSRVFFVARGTIEGSFPGSRACALVFLSMLLFFLVLETQENSSISTLHLPTQRQLLLLLLHTDGMHEQVAWRACR